MAKIKKIKAPLEIIAVIVDRGKGEEVKDLLRMADCQKIVTCVGEGTSMSAQAEFFGFGVIDREIVFALTEATQSKKILDNISQIMELDKPHNGIAMTLPISSASSSILDLLDIMY